MPPRIERAMVDQHRHPRARRYLALLGATHERLWEHPKLILKNLETNGTVYGAA